MNKKKKKYTPPKIEVIVVELEKGIAAGSTISIGGPNGASQPDILNQEIDEQKFDINF